STVVGTDIELVVAGQGTWVYDTLTGALEFTPLGTFEGDPTLVEYNITDAATGTSNDAEVTITYQDRPVGV
ncbi:hypothetical protein, partial [Ruegeria faecimaris]|uniref:hypothetical protein n=1 Tax=Ruegeria faecimaris TaxID=686389 RepID=UPI0024922706